LALCYLYGIISQIKTTYNCNLLFIIVIRRFGLGHIRDFMKHVESIKLREPLAGTLGAFEDSDDIFEYSFIDTVKMAGHSCPTVSAAYIGCLNSLKILYPDSVPVRGEISVTVYGDAEEGVYGVIAQVFSFITGASTETGFKGLGPKFNRKDLLNFSLVDPVPNAMCFEFKRLDNNNKVLLKINHGRLPSIGIREERMRILLNKSISGTAGKEEIGEFHDLWMEKVGKIINQEKIEDWISIE